MLCSWTTCVLHFLGIWTYPDLFCDPHTVWPVDRRVCLQPLEWNCSFSLICISIGIFLPYPPASAGLQNNIHFVIWLSLDCELQVEYIEHISHLYPIKPIWMTGASCKFTITVQEQVWRYHKAELRRSWCHMLTCICYKLQVHINYDIICIYGCIKNLDCTGVIFMLPSAIQLCCQAQ